MISGWKEMSWLQNSTQWVSDNPVRPAFAAAGATAVIIPGVVVAPVLAVAGFGAQGIIGGECSLWTLLMQYCVPNIDLDVSSGSIAAGIQATIGNVAAGGLFAIFQSAGMAGYDAGIVNGGVQIAGVVAAAAAAAVTGLKEPEDGDKDEKSPGNS